MRHLLLSSVAAVALAVAAPAFADSNVDADNGSNTNLVKAVQGMTSKIKDTTATVTNTSDGVGDLDQRTGDVTYNPTTFNAEGLYTLQNQTGINNSGNNGLNVGAQINSDPVGIGPGVGFDPTIELNGSTNKVIAEQTAKSKIRNGDVTVDSNNNAGVNGTGAPGNTTTRTGDVSYDTQTFDASGVYTLQNQTGYNNSGNNMTNVAAQLNGGGQPYNLVLENESENLVHATQSGTSQVKNSDSTIKNDVFLHGELNNRTGDVDYSGETFNAEGLYTLQNQTGQNTSSNNALEVAVQVNDNDDAISLEGSSKNEVVASQTLSASITGSSATVNNNYEPESFGDVHNRTGDVTYATNTFDASGVYTLNNNTGMNNAGNNATNISAQLNGPMGF